MWNPWRRLSELAHVRLRWTRDLPPGVDGLTRFRDQEILLRDGLTAAQERSVLTHELIHLERGAFPIWAIQREETIVCRIAARRLITLDHLADALVWCHDEHEAADHLHVDVPTVLARIESLSPGERWLLGQLLDGAEHPQGSAN